MGSEWLSELTGGHRRKLGKDLNFGQDLPQTLGVGR